MKSLSTIMTFTFLICFSVYADNFNIKTAKDKFEINFSGGKVFSSPGRFIFYYATRHGMIKFTPRSSSKIVSMKVTKDDDKVKRVELKSAQFNHKKLKDLEFHLSLEVRKGSPLLFVKSEMTNNGKETGYCYCFWRISPLYSNVYVTVDGDCNFDSKKLNFDDWIFFPHENKSGGTALIINSKQKNLLVKTYYPKKNWRKTGLYLMKNLPGKNAKAIEKGESNSINFIFFPAKDEEDAEQCWEEVKEDKFFPALNN